MEMFVPWHGKTVAQNKNTLVPHLLNAAKSLIPRLWRSSDYEGMGSEG